MQKFVGVFLPGFHERDDARCGDRMDLGSVTEAADQVVQAFTMNGGCGRKHEHARVLRVGVVHGGFNSRLHADDDQLRILRAEPVGSG